MLCEVSWYLSSCPHRSPVVCGVGSLGLDHTDILGSTLTDIACHKGGIFKVCPSVSHSTASTLHDRAPNCVSSVCFLIQEKCPAVTVVQPPEAMEALAYRASELGAKSLHLAPPLTSYPGPLPGQKHGQIYILEMMNWFSVELGLRGNHQHCNASLAAQLSHIWLQKYLTSFASSLSTQPSTSDGAIPMAQSFVLTKEFRDGVIVHFRLDHNL